MAPINRLKATLKFGPAMSREMRAEFLLAQTGSAPRVLRPETLQKIKAEVARSSAADRPAQVRAFARKMYADHPELGR
jgi:hypothetical protein